MDIEDEIDRIFDREIKKAEAAKNKIIAKKDQELEVGIKRKKALLKQIAALQKISKNK